MQFLWKLRKNFWDLIVLIKHRFNKPADIPVPIDSDRKIKRIPLGERFPGIPIPNILVADSVPADEESKLKYYFYEFQVAMYSIFSAMQAGLPEIDPDSQKALAEAYTASHKKYFPPPVLPEAFALSPDLGALAVAGPYSCYLERSPEGGYQWDLRHLDNYEHREGLYPLGVRVLFEVDAESRTIYASQIECALGTCKPTDTNWELAKKLALCSATTYISLVRHFNWVHLASVGQIAIATRNCLSASHPLRRLLWPHMYGTQYSNEIVTKGQMAKGGDFETTFSFTHSGMCKLFEKEYEKFNLVVNDPAKDAARRGILNEDFDTPTQKNLEELFNVMHRHSQNYLSIYYQTDEQLQQDQQVQKWLTDLDQSIPNGIQGVTKGEVTLESIARLVANFIYLATVQHDLLGTFMWNYQLWVDKQPVRVYKNGQREPLDIYQRLVNSNFNLNVKREQLMDDFSYFGLDDKGVQAFNQFRADLQELQTKLDKEKPAVWRLYPNLLEANINA